MKLSKASWLLLVIGGSIIAFASLGIARLQQIREQDQLNEELSLAEMRLSKLQIDQLSSQREELEEQLSQAMAQLEAAKIKLSEPIENITANNILLGIAEVSGVEVTDIGSSAPASGSLEEINCSVLPLVVQVEGEVSDLISFIVLLNSEFMTGTVKPVSINISENTTASIQLSIYTYRGE